MVIRIESTFADYCRLGLVLSTDNPSGAECYGLSESAMVSWVKDFSKTYHSSTGVYVEPLPSLNLVVNADVRRVLQISRSVAPLPSLTRWHDID